MWSGHPLPRHRVCMSERADLHTSVVTLLLLPWCHHLAHPSTVLTTHAATGEPSFRCSVGRAHLLGLWCSHQDMAGPVQSDFPMVVDHALPGCDLAEPSEEPAEMPTHVLK